MSLCQSRTNMSIPHILQDEGEYEKTIKAVEAFLHGDWATCSRNQGLLFCIVTILYPWTLLLT